MCPFFYVSGPHSTNLLRIRGVKIDSTLSILLYRVDYSMLGIKNQQLYENVTTNGGVRAVIILLLFPDVIGAGVPE